MYHGLLKLPLLGWIFRDAKVIPISPARENAQVVRDAFDRIAAELEAGELVCIFPEGSLTTDGQLRPFRPGVERIVRRTPVPVVPMALVGMWGSFFSRQGGKALRRPFRRVWSRVQLVIGPPLPPEEVSAEGVARRIAALTVSGASKLTSPWSSLKGRSTAYIMSRMRMIPEKGTRSRYSPMSR